jgi:hyperosmotically inducible periplasmic protein
MKAFAFALSAALALALAACASDGNKSGTSSSSGTSGSGTSGSVTSDISQASKDSWLTTKVKSALAADVGLSTLKIDVDSAGNTVTLKGTVDSADKKQRAEEVARKVEGVATVRNQLAVKSGS